MRVSYEIEMRGADQLRLFEIWKRQRSWKAIMSSRSYIDATCARRNPRTWTNLGLPQASQGNHHDSLPQSQPGSRAHITIPQNGLNSVRIRNLFVSWAKRTPVSSLQVSCLPWLITFPIFSFFWDSERQIKANIAANVAKSEIKEPRLQLYLYV